MDAVGLRLLAGGCNVACGLVCGVRLSVNCQGLGRIVGCGLVVVAVVRGGVLMWLLLLCV